MRRYRRSRPISRFEDLERAVRRSRAETSQLWRPYPSYKRFLRDHLPNVWDRVSRCGMGRVRTWEHVTEADTYKYRPFDCHEIPFCLRCVTLEHERRIQQALNGFHLATPHGKLPAFIHVVQTAPIYDDGTGWGNHASRNVPAFRNLVWDAVEDVLGEGLGGLLSYQDFGERCFAKRHPHIDFTLNGWRIQDGQPVPFLGPDLKGGGRSRWDHAIQARATRFQVDAGMGNVRFVPRVVGAAAYHQVIGYQLRELVDFAKLDYDAGRQMVYWLDYHTNRREPFTVPRFLAGLDEYSYRIGGWRDNDPGVSLHVAHGILAKKRRRQTQKIMGSEERRHKANCVCAECQPWERVELDELDRAVGRAQVPVRDY